METTNNRKLVASAVLIVASVALLLGLTFAWFTDSVVNQGNKIQAGTLQVALLKDGEDISASTDPVFDHNLWEPGYSTGAVLSARNDGTLAVKYKLGFQFGDMSQSKGVERAIDVYVLDHDGAVMDGDAPMGTLAEFAAGEKALAEGVLDADAEGDAVNVVLKMNAGAGNEYQGAVANFDILLTATQAPSETDGFGDDQYDAAAGMPVQAGASQESLESALEKVEDNGTVIFSDSVTVSSNVTVNDVDKTTQVDLNGNAFTSTNGEGFGFVLRNGAASISNGSMSTGNASGAFGVLAVAGGNSLRLSDLSIDNHKGNGLAIDGRSGKTYISLDGVTIHSENGGGFGTYGTADVRNCVMTQTGYSNHNSTNLAVSNGGTINVYSGSYTSENFGLYVFNSGGTINVRGGSFEAATVLKADYNNGLPSVINVHGGSFDGAISIAAGASLNIERGTFSRTGLTLEEFEVFVTEGRVVTEDEDVFTVA